MATLSERRRATGTAYVVYFFDENGARKAVSLDRSFRRRQAEEVRNMVSDLSELKKIGQSPTGRTMEIASHLPDKLRSRLVDVGLLPKFMNANSMTIWNTFAEEHANEERLMKGTVDGYRSAMKRFFGYFPEDGDPRQITQNDAIGWLEWLGDEYSEATVAGSLKCAKAMFNWATKRGFVNSNPFVGVHGWSFVNKANEYYVSMESYSKIIEACPDQTWRTMLALNRIGGLRNPSEVMLVQWQDVNWEKGRLKVTSPKTKRYDGKGTRIIPLFPELRKELERQFDQAEEGGSPFVIDRWRKWQMCKRVGFQRIIAMAGLEEWPRLFHNLRGSRSNELFSEYPAHVASAWMGQSTKIAMDHYLHPTDDQFDKASGIESVSCAKTCATHCETTAIRDTLRTKENTFVG